MVLELVGMPGGGKSTLAHFLTHESGIPTISPKGKAMLLLRSMWFIVFHPWLCIPLMLLVAKESSSMDEYWFKTLNLVIYPAAKQTFQKGVIDQGFLQSIISIPERALSKEELAKLLNHLPHENTIILVSVSEEESTRRIKDRSYRVRDTQGEEVFQRKLTYMRANLETLKIVLASTKRTYTVVDGNLPPHNLYDAVHSFVFP